MNDLQVSKGVSLLNLILPKESVVRVSESLTKAGAEGIFQISARGSVLNDGGFFERMFPPPAPEQVLLQALVPDDLIASVTSASIESGSLNKVGSGAVFSMSCNDAHVSEAFPTKILSESNNSETSSNKQALKQFVVFARKELRMI